jgi:hypothetical protein
MAAKHLENIQGKRGFATQGKRGFATSSQVAVWAVQQRHDAGTALTGDGMRSTD